MNKTAYSLLLSLIVCLSISNQALEANYVRFKKITLEQGLPGVSVFAAHQDNSGYLWFGVEGSGLAMYDGRNFTVYSNDDRDTTSISNNFVISITSDKHDRLWLASLNGLNLFNRETKTFRRFFHNPDNPHSIAGNYLTTVLEHPNGGIWVGSENGVSIYDETNDTFYQVAIDAENNSYYVNTIHKDHNGDIWIGTNNYGILHLKKESIKRFIESWTGPDIKKTTLLIDNKYDVCDHIEDRLICNNVFSIENNRNNTLWIGTNNGLYYMNLATKEINKQFLSHPVAHYVNYTTIMAIRFDQKDYLWIGNANEGLVILNTKSGQHTHVSTTYPSMNNINSNSIRAIYEDKSGNIWIATRFDGVNLYDRRQEHFSLISSTEGPYSGLNNTFVMSLYEDEEGYVWIGTKEGGLNKWDRHNNTFSTYHFNLKSKGETLSNRIQVVKGFGDKGLYLGTLTTLEWYEPKTNHSVVMHESDIFDIARDKKGQLWVSTRHGIKVFDAKTKKEIPFPSRHAETLSNASFWALRIFIDSRERIWIGGRTNGLWLLEPSNDNLIHFSFSEGDSCSISGNMIRAIMEDRNGNIWVGTKSDGLNRYDDNKKCFHSITANGALRGKSIYSIEEDENGNFWMGTHDGIVKYYPEKDQAEAYDIEYGIQGRIFEINAHLKLSDGTILLGGQNGLNYFSPEQIERPTNEAPMAVTSFKVFDELRAVDLTDNQTIWLKRKDNYISFEFALLDYSAPLKNQYAYKLTGVDRDWVYCGNRNFVSYTNLPPGEYSFMVKGANLDGHWNDEGLTIKLIMPAPFWMKRWFIVSVLSVSFLILLLTNHLRVRAAQLRERRLKGIVLERTADLSEAYEELSRQKEQITQQNEELELHRINLEELIKIRTIALEAAKEKAEQSDYLKTAFLANMSHEIRTPLNAILGFSELIARQSVPAKDISKVNEIIQSNGRDLLQLIDDILDISMIEANKIQIVKQPIPLMEMFNQIYLEMSAYFNTHNYNDAIELIKELDPSIMPETIIETNQQRIKQVIQNLFTNALKFTRRGSISIGCKMYNSSALFYVKDTGLGISKEHHQTIFERFRKIENSTNELHRGTGLGLSISKTLINLLGGNIWVESKPDEGSTFYFNIPLT